MMPSFSKYAAAGVILTTVWLTGCAIHARRTWSLQPVPAHTIDVFYATDRATQAATSQSPCPAGKHPLSPPIFTTDRGPDAPPSLGRYSIEIPRDHRLGELLPYHPRPACTSAASFPILLTGPQAMLPEEFWRSLQDSLAPLTRKKVLLFIHGYNFEFDEAAEWAAQLRADLSFDGPVILYSWPSHGARLDYLADGENVAWSAPHLKQFLVELAARLPGIEINILAHSMGTRALVAALDSIAAEQRAAPLPLFGQIVFAAPDMDSDVFREKVPPLLRFVGHATLYVSARDEALKTSARLHRYPRAGHSALDLVVLPGMDTIDVTTVDESKYHHNYFLLDRTVLVDLFQIFRDGLPAADRFGLYRVQIGDEVHWRLQP
jgi:esterase/lipase superfamily enzyme